MDVNSAPRAYKNSSRLLAWITAVTVILALLGATTIAKSKPAHAAGVPYALGDVFAGVGGGLIKHYSNTGVLKDTLNTGSGSLEETGMCFDYNPVPSESGSLRSTNFSANDMSKFDNSGNLLQHPWAGGFNFSPESCVLNAVNQIYVGEANGTHLIRKFDESGALLATYNPATEFRGTDWIDLAADQSTIYYTSEGSHVKRFDVAANAQLPDFAGPLPSSPCYALRIRANGEVMVACTNNVFRLSPLGTVMQTYPKPATETSFLFALNLDPDGMSFWTAGYSTGHIYRIDITTGAVITTFTAPPNTFSVAGLAIFGEPVVAQPPDPKISATGTTISATEGQKFSGTVATVTDGDKTTDKAAEYQATIDWGDGSSSPGVMTDTGPGTYSVSGTHIYAEETTTTPYTVKVHIIDTDSSNTADATSTANVGDAGLTSSCPTPATGSTAPPVSGQAFNGVTADFNDSSTTGNQADFTATIDWGDSSTSGGTIGGGPGLVTYTVTGSHTYSGTGTFTVTTTIKDVGGSTTTAKCQLIVFAFPTSNGATFVIGDLAPTGLRNPLPGDHVTWWGSQWATLNPMTLGPPPASMKGFAGFEDNALGLPPACGPKAMWTTDPGNSTPPPATVPDVMGVIVSSHVDQNGSVISGDIKEIVIVQNDPGYAPSPGHPGTGTVLAIVCVS